MKTKIFAALAGVAIITAGCVSTVTDTKTPGMPFTRDSVGGRYQRPLDEVYRAAIQVINNDGKLLTEYIPHDTTNTVRAFVGRVNENKVWVRVETVDPQFTQIMVQIFLF